MIVVDRASGPSDRSAVLALLESAGLPTAGLDRAADSLLVARSDNRVIGSVALEEYPSGVLLRSVAVDVGWRGKGLGQRLTAAALSLAAARGHRAAFLLTTSAAGFFPRFGFAVITRDQVPSDVAGSIEFSSACPATAIVMSADLSRVNLQIGVADDTAR
jgi:amino-acid N-acetyltransferase